MKDIINLTAHEIRDGYKNKEFTVIDVINAYFDNIDKLVNN